MSLALVGVTPTPVSAGNAQGQVAISAFTLDSQPGDYIGQGQSLAFTPANSTFRASVRPDHVQFDITQGTVHFGARISPPQGQTLAPGSYETRRFADAAHAGLAVGGDGRGCNASMGTLTIHKIVALSPLAEEFAATYEQHCEGRAPALFGELRFNSSIGYKAASAPPKVDFDPGTPGTQQDTRRISVDNLGSEPVAIEEVRLANSSDFSVTRDACTGNLVPPGSSCTIDVTWAVKGAGPDSATLTIVENTARGSRGVQLAGIPPPDAPAPPPLPDTELVPTKVVTKLLGEYHKRMGVEFFLLGYPVVQAGLIAPRNAANRLGFEIQQQRGEDWRTVATGSFKVRKGIAAAVFRGRKGHYRARNSFDGSAVFAADTSNWQYFRITA